MKKTNKNINKNNKKSEIEYAIDTVSSYTKRNEEVKKEFMADVEIEYKGEVSIIEGMTEEEYEAEIKEARKEWDGLKDEITTVTKMVKGAKVSEEKRLGDQTGKEMFGSMKLINIESNYKIFWVVWRMYRIEQLEKNFTKAEWKAITLKAGE